MLLVVSAYLTTRGVFLLKALDDAGRWVWANDAVSIDNYFCPVCHAKLIIRSGTLKRNHFAHPKKECNSFSEGETPEHLQGKEALARLFESAGYRVEVESYFSKLKQRPDIVIEKDFQKGIIEFQCAPLTVSKMKTRSAGYRNEKLNFLWILGQKYLLKRKMTQQIAKFLKWNKSQGYYLIYYLVVKQRFRVIYNIQQADYLPLKYKIIEFSNVTELKNFLTMKKRFEFNKISKKERIIQFNSLELDILRSQGKFRDLQLRCYLRRQKLTDCKALLFASKYSPPIYFAMELYWKIDFIYIKTLATTSEMSLYRQAILEHRNYLFAVPLLNVNDLIDIQIKEMIGIINN